MRVRKLRLLQGHGLSNEITIASHFMSDIGNFDDIKNAHATVKQHIGDDGLNVLINNAGMLEREQKITEVNPETMMESYRINAIAPAMIIKVQIFLCLFLNFT